jgi:hypothetical protein
MPISNCLVLHKASLFFHIIDLYLYLPPDDVCSLNNREHRSGSYVGIFYRSVPCQAQADQRHQQCENPPAGPGRQVMRKEDVEQRRHQDRAAVQSSLDMV